LFLARFPIGLAISHFKEVISNFRFLLSIWLLLAAAAAEDVTLAAAAQVDIAQNLTCCCH
jgi:hypothetical protein